MAGSLSAADGRIATIPDCGRGYPSLAFELAPFMVMF
jgi:hypothetical protein